jgi:Bacterial extracellular solute-binding proteins, family 5 Middle
VIIPPRRQIVVAVLIAASACRGGAPGPGLPTPARAPGDSLCTLAAGPGAAARDTVSIAVTDPVDRARAPVPRSDAERLVFAQLYETLLQLDCQGRAVPGLATAWEQSGDSWTFTLRDGARFWDGAPVTARDVAAAWRSRDSALARAVTITGDRAFTVRAPDTPLQAFADRALAITKPAPGGGWPIGTGSRWTSGGDPDTPDLIVARPVQRAGLAVAKIATISPTGVRDALDGGADLLITRDPTALEYAVRLSGYVDLPLEWNRTYVLLSPGHDHPDAGELRLESLRDAVHGDARPAEWHEAGRFWLADLKRCDVRSRDASGAPGMRHRIVYDQSDRSAADLAARLVGLGVLGRGTVAAGVPPAAFPAALRAGGDAWYVIDAPRRVYDACRAAALELPPWIAGGTIEPLLDVRAHAAVRRGMPRLALEWDGTLRLTPLKSP